MDNETRLCFYHMYTCGVYADGEGAGTAGSAGSGVAAAGEHRRKIIVKNVPTLKQFNTLKCIYNLDICLQFTPRLGG